MNVLHKLRYCPLMTVLHKLRYCPLMTVLHKLRYCPLMTTETKHFSACIRITLCSVVQQTVACLAVHTAVCYINVCVCVFGGYWVKFQLA
jgi:hypothetical protein